MAETHASRRSTYRRYHDPDQERLVYVGDPATVEFWDSVWAEEAAPYHRSVTRRSLVVRQTQRWLPPGSIVCEAGCGLARNSWDLHRIGYRAIALDYAIKTLKDIRGRLPDVEFVGGDVFNLPLADGSLDGCWSIGVIEHFYCGYGRICEEMRRVLRPGGTLFLTFPSMSKLRQVKARFGLYERWPYAESAPPNFYQFALDPVRVARDLEKYQFRLVDRIPFLGVHGIGEELGSFGALLEASLSSKLLPIRAARTALNHLCKAWAHHCTLLVLIRE